MVEVEVKSSLKVKFSFKLIGKLSQQKYMLRCVVAAVIILLMFPSLMLLPALLLVSSFLFLRLLAEDSKGT